MKNLATSWFLTRRFYAIAFGLAAALMLLSWYEASTPVLIALVVVLAVCVVVDTVDLFSSTQEVTATRVVEQRLSLGDFNPVSVVIESTYRRNRSVAIIDELPFQFQERSFLRSGTLQNAQPLTIHYEVRPVVRGVYTFGAVNVFVRGLLGLVERRYRCDSDREVEVHPSVMEMRRAELAAFTYQRGMRGSHRIRRLGHTMEFEKIKVYARGDDPRSINWKASARTTNLMVNEYQDERAQDIYATIDLGRTMYAPFEEMTSLDYAVNSSLAFANVVLKKHDNAGLITYGAKPGLCLRAKANTQQLVRISNSLYSVATEYQESNDEHLLALTRQYLTTRSLLMLYTNIDALVSLRRRLPYFKAIAKRHVLVVVVFNNVEVEQLAKTFYPDIEGTVRSTVARDLLNDKHNIIRELKHHGIYGVLARPSELSTSSINAYLNLKARGVI